MEEKNRKLKNPVLAFARRYFSSHELDYLIAISDPEIQRQELMKLWTLKVCDLVLRKFSFKLVYKNESDKYSEMFFFELRVEVPSVKW